MTKYEIVDYSDLLAAQDFSSAAFRLFQILGFTEEVLPIYVAESAFTILCNVLPSELVLNRQERIVFSSIKQLAILFDMTDFDQDTSQVRVFSVDMDEPTPNRSDIQYSIHKVLARKAPYCTIVIFRNRDVVAFSMATNQYNKDKLILLSDWYENGTVEFEDFFAKIGSSLFSISSDSEFIFDLAYLISRPHFVHTLSYEFVKYSLVTEHVEKLDDTIRNLMWEFISQYGDDFVEDEYFGHRNKRIETNDDIDFDLIEYELDQIGLSEAEEPLDYDSENDDDDEAEIEIPEASQIPTEILSDPVKVLKWLADRRETEHSQSDEFREEIG